ncbi:MAG TPA: GIY-YIG nuclease family protein [Xanthobacteraceae bacterium]|nr:GIY-YIG nuclease family protein [Xanthobacteraceae bacterium]
MPYYLYIMASGPKGTLYVGVTSNLAQHVAQHKTGEFGGFTSRYRVDRLVFVEEFARIDDALVAEKRIKRWRRQWKIELIEKANPNWWDQASDYL